jgi:hypothetical protein
MSLSQIHLQEITERHREDHGPPLILLVIVTEHSVLLEVDVGANYAHDLAGLSPVSMLKAMRALSSRTVIEDRSRRTSASLEYLSILLTLMDIVFYFLSSLPFWPGYESPFLSVHTVKTDL